MIDENIAKLTGKLVFDINAGPLHRFLSMLKTAEASMRRVGKEAEALSAKLNKTFGVTGKGASAEKIKLDTAVRKSLDKELSTETKLSKLRRQQFVTQLAEQKLIATGQREEAFLQSAVLRDQVQRAVLAAKQQKAQQESLRTELGKAKLQATVEQSRIREAKLADILLKRQERTVALQRQAASHATAMQRAEQAMIAARERGIRAAEKYAQSKQIAQAKEARAALRAEQQTQRFNMAQDRFAAWKLRTAKPEGVSLGDLAVGVTAASAALYGLVSGVSYLAERVKQRQEGASGAEQFNTALDQSGGKNPANQEFSRKRFVDISNKYGMELSVESAKSYAQFVQGQLALGKSLTQATQMFESQAAVFRAAALDNEAQKRANYQLNQIRAKGKPEGSDVNDLFDAVGGPVASAIRQAAATRLNFKGKVEEQAGWFKKAVTDGKILAKDFDQGLQNYLKGNQDILAKQMNSIAAAQQRAENQAFINENEINSSQELKAVILERVQAERELNEAMQPLKETLATFDLGLTKLSTYMLRFASGRNVDGTEKTEQQKVQDRLSTADTPIDTKMVGVGDYSAINGDTQRQGGPIGKFYNWLFDVRDYNKEGSATGLKVDSQQGQFSFDNVALKLEKFIGQLSERASDESGEWHQFRVPQLLSADDVIQKMTGPKPYYPTQPAATIQEPTTVTNSNNTITVEPASVSITINTPQGADPEKIAGMVKDTFRDEMGKVFREASVGQQENE